MNPNLIPIKPLDINKMPPKEANVFSWIFYFIEPYRRVLVPYFLFRVFKYSVFALLPAFLGYFLDAYVTNKINTDSSFYYGLAIIYLSSYSILLSAPGIFKLEGILTENASRSLALLGMRILNALPMTWHMDQGSGKKIDIINDARKGLFDLMILFRWQMIPVVGNIIGAFVMIMIFDGPLYYAFAMILFIVLYLFSAWHFGKPLVESFKDYRETNAKLLSKLYEFVSSALTVKSLSLESYLEVEGRRLEEEARDSALSIYNANFSKWTKVCILTVVFLLFFVVGGYRDLMLGRLTAGAYSSILMLFLYIEAGLEGLSIAQDKIYDQLSGIRRFSNLCEVGREALLESVAISSTLPPRDWYRLEVKDLSFSYKDNSKEAISELNFILEKGKRLALVGPSGAGKTTLIKLLLRLYQPTSGKILLDGDKISDFSHLDWLKYLAYVPQDIELFDGSIKDNILLGRKDIHEASYKSALENSGVEKFIKELSEGDLTIVGERGLKLSGGQRQRIGIARALIREAKILLLDEATSALDSITERQIQDLLFSELKDVTLVIIAHRLSTIKRADRILVLDEGRLVEEGTFEKLRDGGGKFAEMWESARI